METTLQYRDLNAMLATGDFYGAVSALGSEWPGPGVVPRRGGSDDHRYALLLMTCGVLTAEFGSMGSRIQEKSKDMLSESVRLFGDDIEGAQTARAWLAATYSQCGDFNESLVVARDVKQSKDSSLEVMVCATKTEAIALDGLGFPQAAFDCISEVLGTVQAMAPLTQGKIYLQRGKILRKLGRLDEALEDYDVSMECFYSAKSQRNEAAASNNMAGVYIDKGEFTRAHILTEKAIRLFRDIGDRNYEGMAWDQTAQIYRKEGKLHEAVRSAHTAVRLLEQGDHLDFLAEAYTTQGTVLIERGVSAIQSLEKAAEIYAQQGNLMHLGEVNSLMWDYVVKTKKLGKDTSAAYHRAVRPIERRMIEQALERHGGQVRPAAREMGITHRALTENIKHYFPELIPKLKPGKPRRRSIITKPGTR